MTLDKSIHKKSNSPEEDGELDDSVMFEKEVIAYSFDDAVDAILTVSDVGIELKDPRSGKGLAADYHSYNLDTAIFRTMGGEFCEERLNRKLRVNRAAEVFTEAYEPGDMTGVTSRFYPPSKYPWFCRLLEGKSLGTYLFQKTAGEDSLLTIIQNGEVLHMHAIKPYELEAFRLMKYERLSAEASPYLMRGPEDERVRRRLLDSLDGESPSFRTLFRLTRGYPITGFQMGKTARETIDQLVPKHIPEQWREELMAFLANMNSLEIPRIEPLEYYVDRYKAAPLYCRYEIEHLVRKALGRETPDYVRLLHEGKGNPNLISSEMGKSYMPYARLLESPNSPELLELYKKMNKSGRVYSRMPITPEDALSDTKMWGLRGEMLCLDVVAVRGGIHHPKIGLRKVVHIGRAHGWPHRHLIWSAEMKDVSRQEYASTAIREPRLNLLLMPLASCEQLTHVLRQSARVVDWSYRFTNLRRKTNVALISKAITEKSSLSDLRKKYGPRDDKVYSLSEKELEVLDVLTSTRGIDLELGVFFSDITRAEIEDIGADLMGREILHLSYGPNHRAGSVVLLWMSNVSLGGNAENILSVTAALLRYAYYGTVYVSHPERNLCEVFAVIRVPNQDKLFLGGELQKVANCHGIDLRLFEFVSRWNQTRSLHQRIYDHEAGWSSDISGLLSQIRSFSE